MIKLMLHLRLKNRVSDQLAHHAPFPHLHSEFQPKPRIERKSARPYQIISLPQADGSFVASVSRKTAEDKAERKFLKNPDPHAYTRHPLATTRVVTIDMEYDEDAKVFVTYVNELHRMSTLGKTESAALDNTTEMICGYIKSMQANRKKIPLAASKVAELKRVVGLR
jgi:predicted RNase H-like HicB family nuclease